MASMNNWLDFSLSPQDQTHHSVSHGHHHNHHTSSPPPHGAGGRLISSSDDHVPQHHDVYGLSAAADSSSASSLNIPTTLRGGVDGPFGILEAFGRTAQHHHHGQDPVSEWGNIKGLDFKGHSSELSMLVGSSSGAQATGTMDTDGSVEPKLEDFLGGHNSFANHHHQNIHHHYDTSSAGVVDYMYPNGDPAASANGGASNCIALSMVKNYLRKQPTAVGVSPQHQHQQMSPSGADSAVAAAGVMGIGVSSSSAAVRNAQSLSLSMSTGSQSSCPLPLLEATGTPGGGPAESSSSAENKQKGGSAGSPLDAQSGAIVETVPRKSIDTFGQRTSIYRGVTRHRWTGRYEAHLWDNSCRREGQTRKGRQVYLGGYDKEEKAARAYDLAALKYWGTTTTTNFPLTDYEKELEEMKLMTRQEYVASLRRKSSGFSRGASIYRGVTRHHQHGRWQARIGRVAGNKDLYLGTFSTQEEAAEAYDIAAIKFRGLNAVTNFDMSRYDVKSILESTTLPIGGAAKRLKDAAEHAEAAAAAAGGIAGPSVLDVLGRHQRADIDMDGALATQALADGLGSAYGHHHHHGWPTIAFQQAAPHLSGGLAAHYAAAAAAGSYGRAGWCKTEPDSTVTVGGGYHDLQHLQLGNATHNFFQHQQQPGGGLQNLMGVDSSSMEHSSGSASSSVYNGRGYNNPGVTMGSAGGSNGYMMPLSVVLPDQSSQAVSGNGGGYAGDGEMKLLGYDGMLQQASSATDPYGNSRGVYYLSQQSPGGSSMKATSNGYVDTNAGWMSAAAAASSVQPNGTANIFSVWNDA